MLIYFYFYNFIIKETQIFSEFWLFPNVWAGGGRQCGSVEESRRSGEWECQWWVEEWRKEVSKSPLDYVPFHPAASSFSHCLFLIHRQPTEFYSPMRKILFSHYYFVAILQAIGPLGGTCGFVGTQRIKATQ